jgi:hypothetical protein
MIFSFERLGRMHENNNNFFFYEKLGILIPDLYFYSIKIQTNIKKILVEKYVGKSQFFQKNFLFFLIGPVLPGPVNSGAALYCSYAT